MFWIGIIIVLTCQVVATIGSPSLRNTQVCGTDGLTYKDVDEILSARIENPDLDLLYYGACDTQDQILRENKRPVFCGSNNKTYNSYLDLLVEKVDEPDLVIKHPGPCEVKKENATSSSLRTVDTSVCATDFRTYEDVQELRSAQMLFPGLRMLHSGQCVIPMLVKSGHLRCIDCLFDSSSRSGMSRLDDGVQNAGDGVTGNDGNGDSNGGANVDNGGGNGGSDPLTQTLNQIAHGVFNIVGGSLGLKKGIGLPIIGQSGCQRNCVVHQ